MEKKTVTHESGLVWIKGCMDVHGCGESCFYCDLMREAVAKLAEYEQERFGTAFINKAEIGCAVTHAEDICGDVSRCTCRDKDRENQD